MQILTRQLRESENQINEMLIERSQIQNLQRTCAHLSEEIDNQRQIFERVQSQNKALKSEISSANEQISALTEEIIHLKYEFSTKQSAHQHESELKKSLDEVAMLKEQLLKQSSLISSQSEQVSAAAAAHQIADSTTQRISDQMNRIRKLFEQGLDLSNVLK